MSNAVNIVVHELADRLDELPAAEIWVHCASGYRASVAASILDRHGREVVLIDDAYTTRRGAWSHRVDMTCQIMYSS